MKFFDGLFDGGKQSREVFVIFNAVFEIDIERGRRLVSGVVIRLVDREGEDRWVVGKDRRGAITVVDISIDDQGSGDLVAGLQGSDGYGDVMDGAEAFAVTRIGVMEAPTEVASKAVAKSGFGGQDGTASSKPERPHQFGRIRDLEFHLFAVRKRAGFEFLDPVRGVHPKDVCVGSRFGAEEVVELGNAVVEEFIVNETEFLRRENMGAEVEVVAFMIDELEGEHGSDTELNVSQMAGRPMCDVPQGGPRRTRDRSQYSRSRMKSGSVCRARAYSE